MSEVKAVNSSPEIDSPQVHPAIIDSPIPNTRVDLANAKRRRKAVIHESVYDDQHVLEVENFNFWYGAKQALFDR